MSNYIDGFALPIPRKYLKEYKAVAKKVAAIWMEHGALAYFEYVGDELQLQGTRSFPEALDATADEAIIFGWVVFESREARDFANKRVAADARMVELIAPLTNPKKLVFDAQRMVYAGFKPLVQSKKVSK